MSFTSKDRQGTREHYVTVKKKKKQYFADRTEFLKSGYRWPNII